MENFRISSTATKKWEGHLAHSRTEANHERAVTEWGLVVSGVLLVALGLIWLDSLWLGTLQEPLWVCPNCFLRVNRGQLCFFSELGDNWKPSPEGRDRPFASWVRHYSNWMLPGLEYHNRLLASGETVWSLEVAIVVPSPSC